MLRSHLENRLVLEACVALTEQVLYRTRLVTITDVSCRNAVDHGGVESAEATFVVLPRIGAFALKCRARTPILADPLHALLLRAGDEYVVRHPPSGTDECSVVSVAPALLDELGLGRGALTSQADKRDAPVVDAQTDFAHRRLLRALRAGVTVEPLAAEELALLIVGRSFRRSVDENGLRSPSSKQRAMVRRAQEVLNEHVGEPVSLRDVSSQLGVSPYHLSRMFHRVVGLPMRRYVVRLRLRRGIERLLAGEPDITTLAQELGFADHSHFTNALRRELGIPPRAVRELGRHPIRTALA